ncbi:MAG TPA: hypothetical protein PK624_01095 [Spirochaetota bacterium]|nr:hypothetical protein [Spirochaetota bacterium]HOF32438.1 hypothetical protein [Spirochaetota bacterium]HOR43373.1 hypothetical protein [Spirochaetota bacterium]HOU84832.1 hypothetical protein [Spirochaetota bacterium]HPK54878.1 hypothetical protein [Spirochaetota bacterium]
MRKIRILLGILLILFSASSFYAAFNEFVYKGNIPGIYQSSYFSVLEEEFALIEDIFVSQIIYGNDEKSPWITLEDIKDKHGINIMFYPSSNIIKPPSIFNAGTQLPDKIKQTNKPAGFIEKDSYVYYKPLVFDGKLALFFGKKTGFTAGYFRFEKKFKQNIVIGNERKVIFLSLGTLILFFSAILILHDPDKKIRKIFTR